MRALAGRVLVVLSLSLFALPASAEAPCEDCWNDTCKQFKGVLPQCKGGGSKGPGPRTGTQPQPSVPSCTTVAECNSQCSGGNLGACVALGSMFENGFGVGVDRARAEYWYDFACQAGYQQGCLRLKPFEAERAARAAEERRQAAEAARREKELELERKKQEAVLKEQQREAELARQKAELERQKHEAAEAKARAEREKRKRVEWVAVGPLRAARTEATVLQFDTCVAEGGCQKQKPCGKSRAAREDAPMTCLDWKTAEAFCAWAGGRLPSGAEWQALATNGGTTKYPWGDDAPTPSRAVYNANAPQAVGSAPLGGSKAGLLDVVGSAWEWTSDDAGAGKKEVRGGSWDYLEANLNPESRPAYAATARFDGVGVRCVRVEVGPITVEVEPAEAVVHIDGVPVTKLPWKGALEPGQHRVTAKLETWLPAEQRLTVKKDAPQAVKLTLKKDPQYVPAKLVVSGAPVGAGVSIDGRSVGLLPWEGDVAQGPHTVEVNMDGHEPFSKQVTAKGAAVTKVEVTLKKEAPKPILQTLRLQSEPPGATVFDGKKQLGATPLEVDLLSGPHELSWKLKGYEPQSLKVELPAASPVVAVTLVPLPVDVSVKSTPAGAAVRVDGALVGKTPWSGKLKPGAHEVVLEQPGFERFTASLTAPGKLEAPLKALPTGIRPVVTPAPPGVEFKVDGKVVALMDGVLAAAAGTRKLVVTAPGFKTAEATVKVVAREVASVELQLTAGVDVPAQGLFVTSTPPGADVTVDDARVGATPWGSSAVTPGSHKVVVGKAGYDAATATLEVKKGKLTEHSVTLTAQPVLVAIESVPQGAKILVDGEAQGVTPSLVKLPVGSHRVYLVLEQFEPIDEQKVVEPGSTPRWTWPLKSLAPLVAQPLAVVTTPLVAGLTPEEALRRVVGDNAQSVEVKRAKFDEFANVASDVTFALSAVTPKALQDELCLKWASKVRQVKYAARAVDSFGDETKADLVMNGQAQGPMPFAGTVPVCASRFEARDADGVTVERPGGGSPGEGGASDAYVFPGRKTRFVLSGFGELLAAPFLVTDFNGFSTSDLTPLNPGGGLRWDVWGKFIHFALALKAGTVLRQLIPWSNLGFSCDPGGGCAPYPMPQLDLHLGFTLAAGSESVRYRAALDVGVWSLMNPSLRVTNALSFGERLFLTLTLDLSYVAALYPQLRVGSLENQLLLLGGSFGVGVGW